MECLFEYVTEETVVLRHPNMEPTIRRFFADAGENSVRAFYNEDTGLGGYVFHVASGDAGPAADDIGRYHKLVTTCEVTILLGDATDEPRLIRPRRIDRERIERQFSHNEWFADQSEALRRLPPSRNRERNRRLSAFLTIAATCNGIFPRSICARSSERAKSPVNCVRANPPEFTPAHPSHTARTRPVAWSRAPDRCGRGPHRRTRRCARTER